MKFFSKLAYKIKILLGLIGLGCDNEYELSEKVLVITRNSTTGKVKKYKNVK